MSSEATPEAPRPVAVLDIGSSAIRLLVAEVSGDGATRTLETASKAVRLGRDVFTKGALGAKTIEAACKVLEGYRRIMDELGVVEVRAVATSAVRESSNRDTFLDRVALRTDLEVDVLDAAEETRLTYRAVRSAFQDHSDFDAENTLIAEVGGGSAAIAFVQGGTPAHSGAYALGAIRIRQHLAGLTGGHKAWVQGLRSHIRNVVSDIRNEIPLRKVRQFVGLGGDLRFAAGQLCDENGDTTLRVLPREEFLVFSRRIARMLPDRLARKYDLPRATAESVGPALLAYRELLRATKADSLLVPLVSLRDAVLAELARRVRGEADAELRRQVLASAEAIAAKYRANAGHARRVTAFCESLFDDLAPLHRLGEREKTLLLAAAVLHDIGLFVSLQAHHKHSEYLIRASRLFGLRREERVIVASVARYHRRAMPRSTHPHYVALDRKTRLAVSKLGAILRLANALDRDHTGRITAVRAREEGGRCIVEVEASGQLDMERLSLDKRSDLFQEVYGREVELRGGE